MSYLALYRKYRPKSFEEVVGQEYIVKVLSLSIANDRVSHAYLFSGPRGTGKTSIAKLIAKIVNCNEKVGTKTCEKCASCVAYNNKNNPDIIEIDAASNNGVEEIREIRDKANLMPAISKYKVYIIDEVHMLSASAFNALLKTLEEPPKHVIFILATTEFYKVPETIVSRCQCFDFEKINKQDIIKKLNEIVKKEKIKIDEDVLSLIAKASNGGLRDAINLLDKLVSCSENITLKDFYEISGLISLNEMESIYDELIKNDVNSLIENIEIFNSKGKNIVVLAEDLIEYMKNLLLEQKETIISKEKIFQAIQILNETMLSMKKSLYPKTMFEVGLIKLASEVFINDTKDAPKKSFTAIEETVKVEKEELDSSEKLPTVEEKIQNVEKKDEAVESLATLLEENRKIRINNAFATANKQTLEELKIDWKNLSEYLNNKAYASIVSYLLDGNLKVVGKSSLIISVAYSSILENAIINTEKIEKLIKKEFSNDYKVAFVLDSEWENLKKKYINDKQNGINYVEKEELIIDYDQLKKQVDVKSTSEIVEQAIELFGKDIIEIK